MNATRQSLLDELRQQGVLDEPAAARLLQQASAPWYVSLLSALAAWLAALLLIGGTLFTLIDDSAAAAAVTGAIVLGLAVGLLRQAGVFISQLGLALSLVGQGLLILAASQWDITGLGAQRLPALTALVVAAGMLWVPANTLHRLVCALIAMGAVAVFIGLHGWLVTYGLLLAALAIWLWLRRSHWAGSRGAGIWRALAGAATLGALVLPLIGKQRWVDSALMGLGDGALFKWIYSAGAGALLLATGQILLRGQQGGIRLAVAAAVLVLIALGANAPGLLMALALWLAVFHACERFWSVLVGAGATLYLADLYYSLHITLLEKSILLVVSGLVLLALRWVLLRQWRQGHDI